MTLAAAQEMFYAAPLGGQTCDGKLYGFPAQYNVGYGGAYVNPALFEAAGVTYPPKWQTWDDVVADATKLTQVGSDGVMTVAGLHYTNNDQLFTYFLAGILEQGSDYFADDGKHFNFNSPEAIATIQKLIDMAQTDKVIDPIIFNAESEWVGKSFAQGHNGIGILGSWYVGDARIAYPDLKFDYVSLPPLMSSTPKFASVGGWGYVVSQSTTQPALAWKLAAFLGADQTNAYAFNSTSATIPAMKAVAADPKLLEAAPHMAAVLPILEAGQYQGDLTTPISCPTRSSTRPSERHSRRHDRRRGRQQHPRRRDPWWTQPNRRLTGFRSRSGPSLLVEGGSDPGRRCSAPPF